MTESTDITIDTGIQSSELVSAMDEVARSSAVPRCVKRALDLLSRQLSLLLEEKDKRISELEVENQSLRQKIDALESRKDSEDSSTGLNNTSFDESKLLSDGDFERRRSIIVSHVSEVKYASIRDRVCHDYNVVCQVLQFLGVECYPLAVYRLGRPTSGRDRLLKVVLPSSRFQQIVLNRVKRMRFFVIKGIFIRPSLTAEERRRQRELRTHSSSQGQSPATGEGPNVLSSQLTSEVHPSVTSPPPSD